MAERTVVILNPEAGGGAQADELVDHARATEDWALQRTRGPGDATGLARKAAQDGARLVVAAGGDGTIHEVVGGLAEVNDPPPLAIVPLGTGNDLARSLGIPLQPGPAMEVIRRGKRRILDLVRVELDGQPQLCVNAVTGGFGGAVGDALDADAKGRWGPLSYLRSAVEHSGGLEPYDVRVTVDGRQHRLRALNVVVANGRFAGHGIPIAPHADPFDGWIDVAVVRDAPVLKLSRLLPALLRGEAPDDELFFVERGREVTVESEAPVPYSVDGEHAEARRATFRVQPAALQVLVPPAGEGG